MKTNLLFALVFISSFTFAQQSNLNVFSENGEPFYLVLNGIGQNHDPLTNVRIDRLRDNYYRAKIIFENSEMQPIEKKMLMVVDADNTKGEATYIITKNRKGKLILKFYSFTPFSEILPYTEEEVIHYNNSPMPSGNHSSTTITTQTTTINHGNNVNVGVNVGNVNVGMSVNDVHHSTTTTINNQSSTNVVVVDNTKAYDCYRISNGDFADAIQSIKSKSFSDSKLTLAKQIAKNYCLTTQEIKKIINLFDFESTKLEFAKFTYSFCFDPENYWRINDAFEFESTMDELNRFIGK